MGNLFLPKNMTRSDVMLNMGHVNSASPEELLTFLQKLYYKTESVYQVLFAIETAIDILKAESKGDAFNASILLLLEKIGKELRTALES